MAKFPWKNPQLISLGEDCETMFRINDYSKVEGSFPFSWCYLADREGLLRGLNDLQSVPGDKCSSFLSNPGMVFFPMSGLAFHFRSIQPKAESFISQNDPDYLEFVSRFAHLRQKMLDFWSSGKPAVYFLKLSHTNFELDSRFVRQVDALLLEKQSGPYLLIPIFNRNGISKREYRKMGSKTISPEFVRRFWDFRFDYIWRNYSGDRLGWFLIFKHHIRGKCLPFLIKMESRYFYLKHPKFRKLFGWLPHRKGNCESPNFFS